jgi:L-rhamnose mutarotase
MQRHCLALDLKDDPELIAEYERHHDHIWPEIIHSIKSAGITVLDIYRTGNRLFMIMETITLMAIKMSEMKKMDGVIVPKV